MKTSLCQSLDDYLDHDLTPAERVRFVAHLPECPSCSQAVADHQRLETLLGEAVARLEPTPQDLVVQIEARLRLARRRRWIAAAAALAASAAVIWLVVHNLPQTGEPELPVVKVTPESHGIEPSAAACPVRITFPASANVLVVREKSESPNVTIVRVYSGLASAPNHTQAKETPPSIPERNEQ